MDKICKVVFDVAPLALYVILFGIFYEIHSKRKHVLRIHFWNKYTFEEKISGTGAECLSSISSAEQEAATFIASFNWKPAGRYAFSFKKG